MPTLILPRMYDAQREAVFAPHRYAITEASSKAGKTVSCLAWLLAEAWAEGRPGRHYWWVAPTFPMAMVAFKRMKRMLRNTDRKGHMHSVSEQENSITLESGGCLEFKGSDRPDTLYGEDVYGVVIDEASRVREEAWHAVRSTVTATKGRVRIIGNVKGRKNWAYELARKAEQGHPDMHFARLTAADAIRGGVLSLEEVRDARAHLPAKVFEELFMARASDDGGNPFGIEAIRRCVGALSPKPVAAWGVDLAKSSDWTVAVGLDAFGRVAAFQRWRSDWRDTIQRLNGMLRDCPALVDSTGVGNPIVEELQQRCAGVEGFTFTATSKQSLMEGLAMAIQRADITYPDGEIRKELELFEYEYHRRGVRYEAPSGMHDDCVCALALAVECWTRDSRVEPPSLTVLTDDDEDFSERYPGWRHDVR